MNIKSLSDLVKKAAPRLKEAVETAKDIVGDIKTQGQLYKKTGLNTTQVRKLFESDILKGDTLLKTLNTKADILANRMLADARLGHSPSVQRVENSVDILFNQMISGFDDIRYDNTQNQIRRAMKAVPRKTRPRSLMAAKLKQDRDQARQVEKLSSRLINLEQNAAAAADRHAAARLTYRPGLHTVSTQPSPRGWERVEPGMIGEGEFEPATEAGFDAYIRRKYGRPPTKANE